MKLKFIIYLLMFMMMPTFIIASALNSSNVNYEEIPIDSEVNGLTNEKPLTAYFSDESMEPLIGLKKFMDNISIPDYSIEKNDIKYQLNGDNRKVKLEIISYEGIDLVSIKELEKVFKESSVKWDSSAMKLLFYTKDDLPWEFQRKQQLKHEKVDRKKGEQEYVYMGKMNLFTPGILNIHYSKSNITNSKGNYLSLSTNNQILYGDFQQSTSITDDKISLDYFLWSRELYKNRRISIGDQYSNQPFSMKTDSEYLGVKIYNKNSWGGASLDVKEHSIAGFAQDGLMIELYENGILKDYQISKSSKFNFKVPSTDGINKYEVWIYNNDGTIKKKKIALYGGQNFLEKNTFDYGIEFGQGKDNSDFNPYSLNLKYGLTSDITLGLETYNVDGEKAGLENKKFNNYSLLYKNELFNLVSNNFEVNYSSNLENNSENMYRLELNSDLKIFNNVFGYKNYKELDEKLKTDEYDEALYNRINFDFLSLQTTLGYEKSKSTLRDETRDTYELNLSRRFFYNYISTNLGFSKSYYSKSSPGQSLNMRVSHDIDTGSIKKYLNTVVLGYKTDLASYHNDSYEIMFGKNRKTGENFNYYATIELSEKETRMGLTFNYLFGGRVSATSSSNWSSHNKEEVPTSIGVNASVDFKAPGLLVNPDKYGDSSIHGTAYIDTNNNGIYDPTDEVVEGVSLNNNSSEKVKSNGNGGFFIPNLNSLSIGKFDLKIENDEYLGGYIIDKNIHYETFPGESLKIDIPIKQVKTVIGTIEFDENFYLEDVEKFISNSQILITNINSGEVTTVKLKDEFFIIELQQGQYSIKIINQSVKEVTNKKTNKIFTIKSDSNTEKYITLLISKGTEGNGFSAKLKITK